MELVVGNVSLPKIAIGAPDSTLSGFVSASTGIIAHAGFA